MIHPAKFAALLSIATAIECHCHVVIPAVTIIVGAAINKASSNLGHIYTIVENVIPMFCFQVMQMNSCYDKFFTHVQLKMYPFQEFPNSLRICM